MHAGDAMRGFHKKDQVYLSVNPARLKFEASPISYLFSFLCPRVVSLESSLPMPVHHPVIPQVDQKPVWEQLSALVSKAPCFKKAVGAFARVAVLCCAHVRCAALAGRGVHLQLVR